MTALEEYLKSLDKPFNMFWVTEFTNNYNTHNHLLLKGNIVNNITFHLKAKSFIGDYVEHLPYNPKDYEGFLILGGQKREQF